MTWNKFPDVPAPTGPVLVTSASKVVWMADFAHSEDVWRVGTGRDMVKLPPEAVTNWMPLPRAAGLESVAVCHVCDELGRRCAFHQVAAVTHGQEMSNEDEDMLAWGRSLLDRAKNTAMENAAREAWDAYYFKCTPQVSLEDWTRI